MSTGCMYHEYDLCTGDGLTTLISIGNVASWHQTYVCMHAHWYYNYITYINSSVWSLNIKSRIFNNSVDVVRFCHKHKNCIAFHKHKSIIYVWIYRVNQLFNRDGQLVWSQLQPNGGNLCWRNLESTWLTNVNICQQWQTLTMPSVIRKVL